MQQIILLRKTNELCEFFIRIDIILLIYNTSVSVDAIDFMLRCIITYLEAVPKAVIKTALNLATTRNGRVLVHTKYMTVSVPKPCITNPRSTVAK